MVVEAALAGDVDAGRQSASFNCFLLVVVRVHADDLRYGQAQIWPVPHTIFLPVGVLGVGRQHNVNNTT